jgi:hypothetical protein
VLNEKQTTKNFRLKFIFFAEEIFRLKKFISAEFFLKTKTKNLSAAHEIFSKKFFSAI